MSTDLIKLTTTAVYQEKTAVNHSELVIDKFIEACTHLDARIFEPYMHEDDVFEDKEKYRFLAELYKVFDDYEMLSKGDFYVHRKTGICNGCNKGCTVEQFTVYCGASGNEIGDFGYVINVERLVLINIMRCYRFEGGSFDRSFYELRLSDFLTYKVK